MLVVCRNGKLYIYSPKVTGKTEDEGSVGMVPLLENDNVLKHFIKIDDNDLAIFETAFEIKEEEKKEEKVKTVNRVVKISKKEEDINNCTKHSY